MSITLIRLELHGSWSPLCSGTLVLFLHSLIQKKIEFFEKNLQKVLTGQNNLL